MYADAMAGARVLTFFYIIFVCLTTERAGALTSDNVFDVLDYVIENVNTVQSEVAEIKLDINRIEKMIDNIEPKVIHIADKKNNILLEAVMADKIERRSKAVHKLLTAETSNLRAKVDQFQNMFSELQSDIKSQFSSMNISVGNSFGRMQQTVTDYKADTNATLLKIMNNTETKMEVISHEMTEMSRDAMRKITEVRECIEANAKSSVDHFQNKLSEFQADIQSQLSLMNESVRNLVERFEHHKTDISSSFLDLNLEFKALSNETDNKVEVIGKEIKRTSREALMKINEVGESIKVMASSDLESAKNLFSSKLHLEVTNMTEKLNALEREQVTHGGWGSWTAGTSCTASCSGGMQSRRRHCYNPKASADGDFCDGSASDVRLCNQQQCPRSKASFLVNGASRGDDGTLRFAAVYLNEGSFYDASTGVFTCQCPGLYVFIATIIDSGSDSNVISCAIRRNDPYYASLISVGGPRAVEDYGTATAAVTVHLDKGDRVDVFCPNNSLAGTSHWYSSFNGFLVSADT